MGLALGQRCKRKRDNSSDTCSTHSRWITMYFDIRFTDIFTEHKDICSTPEIDVNRRFNGHRLLPNEAKRLSKEYIRRTGEAELAQGRCGVCGCLTTAKMIKPLEGAPLGHALRRTKPSDNFCPCSGKTIPIDFETCSISRSTQSSATIVARTQLPLVRNVPDTIGMC